VPTLYPKCDGCRHTYRVSQAPWLTVDEALDCAGWYQNARRGKSFLLCPTCKRRTAYEVFRKVRSRTSYLRRRPPRKGGIW